MLALLLALAPTLHAEEITRTGDHFEIICHFANLKAADQALEAVEATWRYADQMYALGEWGDRDPMPVHLYRNADEYRVAEERLTKGAFRNNLAFTHHDTQSAHVALQPPLVDAALDQVGLPAQTLRLLAHEAAHLIRYSHNPNFRSHPGWLADGTAAWIDEMVSKELKLFKRIEEDPYFSTSIVRVKELIKRNALPTFEQLINDQTDNLKPDERYPTRWLMFRFFNKGSRRNALIEVLAETRRFGGGSGFTEKVAEAARVAIGEHKLKTIDKDFRKYVGSFEPAWNEIYRSMAHTKAGWIQAAFPDTNAICWRQTESGKKYSVSGELTILAGSRHQLNVFLGKSDTGFFSVAFTAGDGVFLFEYLSATNEWLSRGSMDCADVLADKPFSFNVMVEGKEVEVEVNGKSVVSSVAQEVRLDGPWGLSTQSGATGIWKIKRAPGL